MNVVQSSPQPRPRSSPQGRPARVRKRASRRGGREVKPAEERRKDILDAAQRLFVRQGFNETTVGDIAEEAGMGTGTMYLYFPSKEHVLEGLHLRFRDESEARIAAVAVDAFERAAAGETVDYRATIDAILDGIAGLFIEKRDLVVVCTKYRPELLDPGFDHTPQADPHLGIVARALSEGVRLGLIHTSDPDMTAYLFDAALAYNLHMHVTYGDPPDLDRLIAAAKEMFHKTLALPGERKAPAKAPARGSRRRSPGR